ncbi:MAG: PrsW family intramembrane metalloprotease, partial [Angustibacter sp.]
GLTLALIPVVIVLPTILWLDRFEAEPVPQLLFAFGWGAIVATASALLVNTYSLALLASSADSFNVTAVLVAPWVEEGVKGLAVLAVYLWRREEFDGIIDGIVYAGLAGLGFAFTENVFYLGKAFQEAGTSGLAVTFVLRAIFGPFAHPLFTMAIGVGLGISVGSRRSWLRALAPIAGLIIAVTLHAAWNLSALAGFRGFVWAYVLFQLPIFLGAISFALWARRRESRLIRRNLWPYVHNGWFTEEEGRMLASTALRSEARAWAASVHGATGLAAMRSFQRLATELAFARDRGTRARLTADQSVVEATLLYEASAARLGFIPNPN